MEKEIYTAAEPDNGFTRNDYDDATSDIKCCIARHCGSPPKEELQAILSNRLNVLLGALDTASHLMRIREEWIAERGRMIHERTKCHLALDGAGIQYEHHGEERPLTLLERIECLVAEAEDASATADSPEGASNIERAKARGEKP